MKEELKISLSNLMPLSNNEKLEILKYIEKQDKEIERLNSIINNDFSKICREKMIDKLSANEMILLQDKEIERLNNIINELEKYCNEEIEDYDKHINSKFITDIAREQYEGEKVCFEDMLGKLQELKGLKDLYYRDKNCLEELITAYDEKDKEIERLNNIINTMLEFNLFAEECPLNFGYTERCNEEKAQDVFYEDDYCEQNCNDIYKKCWLKYFEKLQKLKENNK